MTGKRILMGIFEVKYNIILFCEKTLGTDIDYIFWFTL